MLRPRLAGPSALTFVALAVVFGLGGSPAFAWSPATELSIAERAARFAPKALARQIDKHQSSYREGVLTAKKNPAAGQSLDKVLHDQIERAVDDIRNHRPFAEIVQHIGQAVHYVAAANDPLEVGNSDPSERRYASDYPRYVESAQSRFRATFYGDGRRVEAPGDLERLIGRTFARGYKYYPMLAGEYQRIQYGDGRRNFDDRSTAYGISALAYSHSISDSIGVLRYIWLRSGGADARDFPTLTSPSSP